MESQSSSFSGTFVFFVNGRKISEEKLDPEWNLLYYLRYKLRLPGAKNSCGEGGCGACTVMVSCFDRKLDSIRHYTVNACLTPVASLHGLSVTTVEGVGSTRTRLHPVQERLAKAHGSQCGFCTPGIVMSMYALLRNNSNPSLEEIEDNLVGNLCRCTGYRPVLEGFASFSSESFASGCGKSDCCQLKGNKESCEENTTLFDAKDFLPYDSTYQELIFPVDLKLNESYETEELLFAGSNVRWFRPVSLESLLQLKASYPEAQIVAGNTEVGIASKFLGEIPPVQITPFRVKELHKVYACKTGLILGSALTISRVEEEVKKICNEYPASKTKSLQSLLEMLRWFACKQIKNMATLGGNIMASSPVSDLNPVLIAAGAELKFKTVDGQRKVILNEEFFTGHNTNASLPEEVLIDIFIPYSQEDEYFCSFKQSRRRYDDIATVNAGFKVQFEPSSIQIQNITIAFGGMAAKTVVARSSMKDLKGMNWDEKLLEMAIPSLLKDFPLNSSSPGGMVQYRRSLVLSFFFKFFLRVKDALQASHPDLTLEANEKSVLSSYNRPTAKGSQFFHVNDKSPVGKPLIHSSGLKHSTGEAVFVDDIPRFENEICAALVLSKKACAKILDIDASDALEMEGVRGFYCAVDVPGDMNKTGIVIEDEEVFASDEVKYVGEVVGIVVADDILQAKKAAKRIKISYEEKIPILTIEHALEEKSTWKPRTIKSGNVIEGFKNSENILEGEIRIGGQEHYYMETQTCIVIPREGDQFEIISATQHPAETQRNVAKVLGLPLNQVVCKTKRLGGGFGGKEIKAGRIASYVAVAAQKSQCPVRLVLERDEDMQTTGGRHPMFAKWRVGFNNDGSLVALDLQMCANAGYSLDVSDAMAVKAIIHSDNVYRIPNTLVSCVCCKTNLASNTACRGTGAPQSMLIMEDIITRMSAYLDMKPHQVREINLHKTSNPTTHYGQTLEHCTVKQCWDEVLSQSDFLRRRKEVDDFNRNNAYVKRGIAAVPSKMAVSFGVRTLEQAGAMVHIYLDGSVLVTHGGVEMGQGLHTKMIQIASQMLGVPIEAINITETSTDKIPNTSPSAASCSSDLNGMAVKAACEQLVERLKPYKEENPQSEWIEWIKSAYNDRVSLLGIGFYKTPGLVDFDFEKQSGNPINYFSYGAAVSEVEVDILTGNHTVLQTDIVMDAGQSLNPAIDIGQVEGAFILGYGLYTLEELQYSPQGELLTQGPATYKIPCIQDIPCKLNVSLLKGSSNPRAVFSSRGVGEPPLFLASSVFFAIKDAISHPMKRSKGESTIHLANLRLDSPATTERIRMAIDDKFTKAVNETNDPAPSEGVWCIRV